MYLMCFPCAYIRIIEQIASVLCAKLLNMIANTQKCYQIIKSHIYYIFNFIDGPQFPQAWKNIRYLNE